MDSSAEGVAAGRVHLDERRGRSAAVLVLGGRRGELSVGEESKRRRLAAEGASAARLRRVDGGVCSRWGGEVVARCEVISRRGGGAREADAEAVVWTLLGGVGGWAKG